VNTTVINTTAVGTAAAPWFSSVFLPTLLDRLSRLVGAPFQNGEMIYIITPMLLTLLLMEFYFGRYDREELGWNTAVGNALVLLFVSVDLLKTIYPDMAPSTLLHAAAYNLLHFSGQTGAAVSTLITALIFTFGVILLITNFFHWLPKKLAFFVSSSLTINLTAYVGIVLVYTNRTGANPLPVDWYTILAALLLFAGLWLLFTIIHALEPKYKGKRRQAKKLAEIAPAPPPSENTVFVEPGEQVDNTPPR